MDNLELRKQIHEALISIRVVGPKDEYLGICGNVVQILGEHAELDDDVDSILTELFSNWPDKSSSTAYPVGSWSLVPSKLFWHFHDNRMSLWDRKTRFGAARWALLEHCLVQLDLNAK